MIFYETLFFVVLASCTTGEIFVSDGSFPDVTIPQSMQRQFFVRLPGLVAPPRAPVPVPAPYVAPRPVPILPPPPAVTAPVNVAGITRVPGSAPSTLQPCSSKCCLKYCKFIGSCNSAMKKEECEGPPNAGNSPKYPADKCYNAEADGCLPKQCSMPTSCKNPCSTAIDIITDVAFCEP